MNPEYQKQADADYECGYEMAKLKMERDEALAALETIYGNPMWHPAFEQAKAVLKKHNRLPAAGGAE